MFSVGAEVVLREGWQDGTLNHHRCSALSLPHEMWTLRLGPVRKMPQVGELRQEFQRANLSRELGSMDVPNRHDVDEPRSRR